MNTAYISSRLYDLSLHNYIYFSSIVKYKSLSSPLTGTNQYWCHMRNHGRDSIWCSSPRPLGCEADTLTTLSPLPSYDWYLIIL